MSRRLSPFGIWLKASGRTYHDVADELGTTYGSVRHYAYGMAVPRPATASKLKRMTGLSLEAINYPWGENARMVRSIRKIA